jgi:hypothetical protein
MASEKVYTGSCCQETVLRIHDGKPKFKDMPKEMAGSGVSLPE